MRSRPDYYYNQSAVIPFRRMEDGLQVLMITSRKAKRWVIPKGIIEPNLSPAESAAKEALEEAGIRGRVSASPIGSYRYEKWGDVCTVQVFEMEVEQELAEWDESFRDRQWLSLEQAASLINEPDLKQLVRNLADTV